MISIARSDTDKGSGPGIFWTSYAMRFYIQQVEDFPDCSVPLLTHIALLLRLLCTSSLTLTFYLIAIPENGLEVVIMLCQLIKVCIQLIAR